MKAKTKLGISAANIAAVIISSYSGDIASMVTNVGTSNNNNSNENTKSNLLRVGYFPNLYHAQAVIGFPH